MRFEHAWSQSAGVKSWYGNVLVGGDWVVAGLGSGAIRAARSPVNRVGDKIKRILGNLLGLLRDKKQAVGYSSSCLRKRPNGGVSYPIATESDENY
ncbi:hypothetical protein [Aureliella helgolandensis]|nr:hypothetical protein [Aureliella helgolandensis]